GQYTQLDVPGATSTVAYGINNAGQIVGYYIIGSGEAHGFLLSDGKYTSIDVPGASATYAFGINSAGQIVGEYWNNTGQHGFLLSQGKYTQLDVPGSLRTSATGIDRIGQIVGWYIAPGGKIYGFVKPTVKVRP